MSGKAKIGRRNLRHQMLLAAGGVANPLRFCHLMQVDAASAALRSRRVGTLTDDQVNSAIAELRQFSACQSGENVVALKRGNHARRIAFALADQALLSARAETATKAAI